MRPFLIFLFAFSLNSVLAQTPSLSEKRIADTVHALYNQVRYNDIISLFTEDMKKVLPVGEEKDFFAGLHNEMGDILEKESSGRNNGYAQYKAKFEKGVMQMGIAVHDARIAGIYFKLLNTPASGDSLPVMKRNATPLRLPFDDEWTVTWGGDTKELNHHVSHRHQKNAFDIVITDPDSEGKSYKTDGKTNEDYYAFGKEILAPCDGEVVEVIDGVKDNNPGEFNKVDVPGNMVMLKTAANEYLFFAHFKNGTVKVKKGDTVKTGQLLGLCGNSGNSSEPHLHFHVQTIDKDGPIGVKSYFEKIQVNGNIMTDYSPIQGDKIKNIDE